MNAMTPQVDGYLRKSAAWRAELQRLRTILLERGLTEAIKWRVPCYTSGTANVVLLGRFKDSCVLSFVKGALLKDPQGVLAVPGENSQSVRVIRFTDVGQIDALEPVLKAYIDEAVDVEKAGLKVAFKKIEAFDVPDELRQRFGQTAGLETAFRALTPGRQRGYLLHFGGAKQSKTRAARVEKCEPRILAGKGLDD